MGDRREFRFRWAYRLCAAPQAVLGSEKRVLRLAQVSVESVPAFADALSAVVPMLHVARRIHLRALCIDAKLLDAGCEKLSSSSSSRGSTSRHRFITDFAA